MRQFLFSGCGAALLLWAGAAAATPVLRCQIEQGGTRQQLSFGASSDPYTIKAIDINGRFLFKAVMIGDAQHIEYIKLYTYDQARRQPVLIQEVKYLAPVAGALTGLNYVYSPRLERELQYQCTLAETQP